MPHSPSGPLEAVFLLQDNQILRELLYPEFEAILDGFIPLPDYASTSARAIYVQANHQLCITGAVFFLIGFDAKGIVDHRWNVPLQQLLASAGPGPDLGAGAIRLVCYSQCPVAWHQKNLWDPRMEPGQNTFVALAKSIRANRLGFIVNPRSKESPEPSLPVVDDEHIPVLKPLSVEDFEREQQVLQQQLHEYYTGELRDKVAQLAKEQRLRLATLNSELQSRLQAAQHEHQQRLTSYQQRMAELETANQELEERNRVLKESLDTQVKKIDGVREYFAHKLKSAQADEASQLQALQANFDMELDVRVQAATAELREMLEMREVELFYRHQNETALKEEIVSLKREAQAMVKNGGDQLLSRLVKSGISFVTFQPGIGQLSIPLDDVAAYLENTATYLAQKSGVSEPIYLAWWEHYQKPCCNALDARGHACGTAVTRIESPLEFLPGESDRCSQHQAFALQRVAERR
ncbi:hypothetical protein [Cellvibrio japonicus]|uniref:Chromosome partitioning protein ParA n=1 Tax=Cellvibrio japonicus (strain Ueda107) TaxID=498211 RepID=B3PJ70_CELJU|nr:hypothetical protein [Cellvibrio japonicus]ACE85691.1 conserved hypothetical protein [Cellvibrio japonicus Ueda107]QEI12630.1 hypothetical protein FY117_10580 [Cellvibrio japonicus]QEI16204.1 hypothetical protein FY116_10585 [Cellvibrio japonicus]QEI19782.1 hypothetical protein FY115_10580 [Cellvibrio japonicus]